MEEKTFVEIYTDGACSGNPGNGGYGAIIKFTDSQGKVHEKELTEGFLKTTNNRMELLAPIVALEALTKPCKVDLYSDSKYLTDAFNQNWIKSWEKRGWKTADKQPVKNLELWQRLLKAMEKHEVKYIWVKGHNGHEYNERCDRLAVESSKNATKEDL